MENQKNLTITLNQSFKSIFPDFLFRLFMVLFLLFFQEWVQPNINESYVWSRTFLIVNIIVLFMTIYLSARKKHEIINLISIK